MPKILSSALKTLREEAVICKLVNKSYSNEAAQKGSVINIPVPTRLQAYDVTPGPYATNTPDFEMKTVPVPLNNWKESPFYLTDRDVGEIMDGVPNVQIVEAARALANEVNLSVYQLYTGVFNSVGVAGTTPFSNDNDSVARQARKVLSQWLAPKMDRNVILDLDAEAEALGLSAFRNYYQSNDDNLIKQGEIGTKFGFDWYSDQLASIFHGGATLNTRALLLNGARAAGVGSITLDAATLTGTIVKGDLLKFAGTDQTYTVLANATAAGNAVTVTISPVTQVPYADNTAVTVLADHAVNLAFHRDAIALAMRTLSNDGGDFTSQLGGETSQTMVDDQTGIPLRLEVKRENKRTRWSLDILWGTALVRPQNVVRILG